MPPTINLPSERKLARSPRSKLSQVGIPVIEAPSALAPLSQFSGTPQAHSDAADNVSPNAPDHLLGSARTNPPQSHRHAARQAAEPGVGSDAIGTLPGSVLGRPKANRSLRRSPARASSRFRKCAPNHCSTELLLTSSIEKGWPDAPSRGASGADAGFLPYHPGFGTHVPLERNSGTSVRRPGALSILPATRCLCPWQDDLAGRAGFPSRSGSSSGNTPTYL